MASQCIPGYRVHECRGVLAHERAGPINEQYLCTFCAYLYSKREISAETFHLYEAHCSRNITLCELCQEPVPLEKSTTRRSTNPSGAKRVSAKMP